MATRKTDTPTHRFATLEPGKSATVSKVTIGDRAERAGSLEARKLTDGAVRFYWRMTRKGETDRIPIGLFDPLSPPAARTPSSRGYSVRAAEDAAHALASADAAAAKEGAGGLRAQRKASAEAAAAAAHAAAEAAEAQRRAAELAAKYTMGALVLDYAQYLQDQGKLHGQVRSLYRNWIADDPAAALPANAVTLEQVADLLRRVTEAGHARTRERVRSVLLTAYKMAMMAPIHDAVPVRFKAYRVTVNPAEATPCIQAAQADKNPLTLAELRSYWNTLRTVPGLKGALLRLHLLTGGQRIRQLCAAKAADLKADTLTLHDLKGRRKIGQTVDRPIVLPLVPQVAQELANREALPMLGDWLFSTDGGKTHVTEYTLSGWAKSVVGDTIPGFTLKRIRSTVETELARLGVSKDLRGRLQSHGQGGVQSRHYDAHDYLPEVADALNRLYGLLQGHQPREKVIPLPRRRAA